MIKEQFHEWKANPTTLEVFEEIRGLKSALADSLASGNTICSTTSETALVTARIVGIIEGLNQLLDFNYEGKD